MFRSLTIVAIAAVSAVILSACSSGGAGSDNKLRDADSPVSQYTSALWSGFDQAKYDQQEAEIQALIAECMKEQGFEYLPAKNNNTVFFTEEEALAQETEEWVASNGYGMIHSTEEMKAQREAAAEFTDPNQGYVDSLSAAERSAYNETLHGPGPSADEAAAMEDDGSYEYNWKTGGCYGASQHEVQDNSPQAYDDPTYASLFEGMDDIYSKVDEDPRIKELDKKWAGCMAEAGFSGFAAKDDAMASISDAQADLWANQDFDEQGLPLGDADAALAELVQHEIDVALADFTCTKKSGYDQLALKVRFELEKQFIEDNKAELDAMLATYATKK